MHFRRFCKAHICQTFASQVARAVNVHRRPVAGPTDPYTIAQCVGAVYDMANFIGWAGLNIDALSINGTCPDTEDDTTCSANAVGFLFNLMWVLNNAAQIPIWCVKGLDENSTMSKSITCLVSMSLFFASSLQITADGIAVKTDCEYLLLGRNEALFPTFLQSTTFRCFQRRKNCINRQERKRLPGI